ncbi:MAG: fibronectin type III domain-containing protein [Bacteroidaceae bacterium]|nr:fibronectin type III domain-containing protein [Bacteroidaceae bacterium]
MKQKILLLMLLLLSCWGGARAAELTVYDGTTTSLYVPLNITASNYYQKCEFIIEASRLIEMRDGTLEAMTFYTFAKSPSAWTTTFQVFLKEVNEITLSTFSGTDDATIVYEGTLDATTGTTLSIDFSTPYTYGGRHLLVGVYVTTTKGSLFGAPFYGTNISRDGCVQGSNISSLANVFPTQRNFIPRTTFTYERAGGYKMPKNITPSNLTYSGVTYSWTAPDGATGYVSEYKKTGETEWTTKASTTETSVDLSGLTPETAYQFRVKALYEGGNSDWVTRNFTTLEKWKQPTNLQYSEITYNSAKLSWTENGEATSWVVAYKKADETNFQEVTALENPFTLTGLKEYTKYTVKVRPNSDDGTEKWSSQNSFTTKSFWTAPTLNSVSDDNVTYNSAKLSWKENGGATEWVVAYKKYGETDDFQYETVSDNPFTLTGLDADTQYTVKVRPNSNDGQELWSSTQTFKTKEQYLKPSGISLSNIGTEWATIGWWMSISSGNSGTPTPDSYVLSYRVKVGEGETVNDWTVITGITERSYKLEDLVGGTQYEVCVQAQYGENLSGYYPSTTPATFTTLSYCTVPSNLLATDIMRDEATLSWTGYQDSYNVQWREVPILFMDGFEDGLDNWTLRDCYRGTGISTSSFYNHTGKQSFYFHGDQNQVMMDQKLISPELNDIPEGAKLSFWYCGSGKFYVGYSTATNSSEDFKWEKGPYENTEMSFEVNWGKYEFTLPADVKYIGISFRYYGECYIDDILITGPESAFGEWKTAENQGNPCTITGLKPDTYYEWQVMGKSEHCSGTDWSESRYFTTLSAQTKFFVKDGDWNDGGNWDPVGVPEPTEDVYIAAKATIPVGYVADVQELTVFPGGSITLKDGGQLKTISSNVPVTFEKDIKGYGTGDGTNHFIATPVSTLLKDVKNLKTDDYDLYLFYTFFSDLEWINGKNLAAYYPPDVDPDESFNVVPKEGYLYASKEDKKEDKTLKFTGSTEYPSKLYVTQSRVYSGSSSRFDGWFLVGNPYTCDAYVTLQDWMDDVNYVPFVSPIVDCAVFYKLNATGDALNMYYDCVKLAPGEGVLVHVDIPTSSGSGPTPSYGITFFTENIYGDAMSPLAQEGDYVIPILPRHGLTEDQDANGIVLMNDEDNSDIIAKYDYDKLCQNNEFLTKINVTLQDRTLFTDRWNTLCLPFEHTLNQDSPLAGFEVRGLDTEASDSYDHITGYEESSKTLWLNFKDPEVIEAGKPCLIRKETVSDGSGTGENIVNPTFVDVKIDSSDPVGVKSKDGTTTFQGVYDPVVFAKGTKKRDVLFLQNNYLYYPNGEEATTIGACRAYFPLNGIYGGVPDLSIKSFVLNFGDGETSIQEIVNGKSSNGKSDEWYSIDGRKLEGKPTQGGVYISNGRKVLLNGKMK